MFMQAIGLLCKAVSDPVTNLWTDIKDEYQGCKLYILVAAYSFGTGLITGLFFRII